jgi:hypothetical protein
MCINRNLPFYRQFFIDEKKATEAAFSKGTWFVVDKIGDLVEEPMPECIKATGKIPEGYALGKFKLLVLFSVSYNNDRVARS